MRVPIQVVDVLGQQMTGRKQRAVGGAGEPLFAADQVSDFSAYERCPERP